MTQPDTGQRRRTEDFQLHPEANQDETWPAVDRRTTNRQRLSRAPGRAWLRRFRTPIIGLSMAGAMGPLIAAQEKVESGKRLPPTTGAPTEADRARMAQATQTGADAEEQLASRIEEESVNVKQASIVGSAVEAFDIDESLAKDIYEIAEQEGIDPKLAYGLVKTESAFKNRAISHVGARGLTQVMPRTARWMSPGTKADDLYDQKTNLKLGFRYLNQMIDKYKGDVRLALLAYNRGPGTVDKVLRRGGNPNNGYADKVLRGSREI